ncbi:MAG: arylsulfatase [Gammaproteobacteria bacterium]|nr:arylsulfatase [Gammaproteobacteria bacterium]
MFSVKSDSKNRLARALVLLVAVAVVAAGMTYWLFQKNRDADATADDMAATGEVAPDALSDIQRPNIVLIIADDMGIADLGAFGGEIPTPNLDRLAFNGLRLNNFHVSPTCSPTRATLFSGVDHHLAGLGNMAEELAPNQIDQKGYEGYLNFDVATLPELLRQGGYHTYFTGKWHLGKTEETSPYARGFEQSFAMLSGAADHYNDLRPVYAPTPDSITPYRENGVSLTKLPAEFKYSTQFYTDRLIEQIDSDVGDGQPFFAVLSLTAPHWPVQAPTEIVDRYRGRYDAGFDEIVKARIAQQKALGLVDAHVDISARAFKGAAWEELSEQEQRTEIRAMEIYAAMIDRIDYHTGRLIGHLQKKGLYENTLIVFMSDDGAEGHDLDETWPKDKFPQIRQVVEDTHDFSYESMGMPNSYVLYGPNWARVSAPVFRLHKGFTTEGGVRAASFWHYPARLQLNAIHKGQFTVKDIAPTLLALAGVEHPGSQWQGRAIHPMTGINIWPYLSTGETPPPRPVIYELFGKRYIKEYPWKMLRIAPPYGTGEWELYNLAEDLAESRNLAGTKPEIQARLELLWQQYVSENNVIEPDWVSGY